MPIIGQATAARDLHRDRLDHALDHHARTRRPRAIALRIVDDLGRLLLRPPARAIAAERVHRLRGQPDMPHHRNAALGQEARPSAPSPRRPPASPPPRRSPSGAAPRCRTPVSGARLVAAERHVDDRPPHDSCRAPPPRRARPSSRASPARSRAGRRSPAPGCRRPAAVAMRIEQLRHPHRIGGQHHQRLARPCACGSRARSAASSAPASASRGWSRCRA